MITIKKLKSLKKTTRYRKTVSLIREFGYYAASGHLLDIPYLIQLVQEIIQDNYWGSSVHHKATEIQQMILQQAKSDANVLLSQQLVRVLNELGHLMLGKLGISWADWDSHFPRDGITTTNKDIGDSTVPICIYLNDLRSPFNVGAIARTAQAFGIQHLWLSPECASLEHPRARRSAMGAADWLNWQVKDIDNLGTEETGTLFALELGGTPLDEFQFPFRGTVVLGSEELGISPDLLKRAQADGGVVSIPLYGLKASLNVAVAFGILIQRWTATMGYYS